MDREELVDPPCDYKDPRRKQTVRMSTGGKRPRKPTQEHQRQRDTAASTTPTSDSDSDAAPRPSRAHTIDHKSRPTHFA